MREALYWIAADRYAEAFPPLEQALREPDGLLAAGGDLSVPRLLEAYRQGIFPWYSAGQPILWWAPDPRAVLDPAQVKVSRSLRRTLAAGHFRCSFDRAFAQVIGACAAPRRAGPGTWITPDMRRAYLALHAAGHAHSVETWQGELLAGGLYGVAIGRVFFGESMFTKVTDASKVALVHLARWLRDWDYALIDCQVHNPHLASLGARTMPRAAFAALLARLCREPAAAAAWRPAP